MNFREDINGLRAWAVVLVILFHYNILGVSGGYIGVDVFFVISGFLMTSIIVKGLEANKFSLPAFYFSRARRIIPALAVLSLFVVGAGWFFLPANAYEKLALHALSAILFVSNIIFWRESGYFDAASHEKLLLHTWSLSVEWQFYLAFPIFVIIIWKLSPSRNFCYTASLRPLLPVSFCVLLLRFSSPAPHFIFCPPEVGKCWRAVVWRWSNPIMDNGH